MNGQSGPGTKHTGSMRLDVYVQACYLKLTSATASKTMRDLPAADFSAATKLQAALGGQARWRRRSGRQRLLEEGKNDSMPRADLLATASTATTARSEPALRCADMESIIYYGRVLQKSARKHVYSSCGQMLPLGARLARCAPAGDGHTTHVLYSTCV